MWPQTFQAFGTALMRVTGGGGLLEDWVQQVAAGQLGVALEGQRMCLDAIRTSDPNSDNEGSQPGARVEARK